MLFYVASQSFERTFNFEFVLEPKVQAFLNEALGDKL